PATPAGPRGNPAGGLPVRGERPTSPAAAGAPAGSQPGQLPVRGAQPPWPGAGLPPAAHLPVDDDPLSGPVARPAAAWEPPRPDPSHSGQFRSDLQGRGQQPVQDPYRQGGIGDFPALGSRSGLGAMPPG